MIESENNKELEEFSGFDNLQLIVDNLRILIIAPLVFGLIVLGIAFIMKPKFVAEVTLLPPQKQGMGAGLLANLGGSLGGLGGLAGAAAGIKNPADQYVAFLQSRSIQDALIDRFDLLDRYEQDYRNDLYELMEKKYITVTAGKKDGIIRVQVEDQDPEFAAKLANAHVDELSKLLDRLAITEAQERRQFFEKQLESTNKALIKAEKELKKIGVSSDLLKTNPLSAVSNVATLDAQLTAQQVKISNMRGYLSENSAEFKQALKELTSIKSQMEQLGQIKGSNAKDDDYITRYRDFKYQETLFELYAKQLELARADELRDGSVIQVIDTAVAPDKKSKPRRGIMAIIATLLYGVCLLIFIFMRREYLKKMDDAKFFERMQSLKIGLKLAFKK